MAVGKKKKVAKKKSAKTEVKTGAGVRSLNRIVAKAQNPKTKKKKNETKSQKDVRKSNNKSRRKAIRKSVRSSEGNQAGKAQKFLH